MVAGCDRIFCGQDSLGARSRSAEKRSCSGPSVPWPLKEDVSRAVYRSGSVVRSQSAWRSDTTCKTRRPTIEIRARRFLLDRFWWMKSSRAGLLQKWKCAVRRARNRRKLLKGRTLCQRTLRAATNGEEAGWRIGQEQSRCDDDASGDKYTRKLPGNASCSSVFSRLDFDQSK